MAVRLSDFDWQRNAVCAEPKHSDKMESFFAETYDERAPARALCVGCLVRRECLKWALEGKHIWGVWGGLDEQDIRRVLSVSSSGQESRSQVFYGCPHCGTHISNMAVKTVTSPTGGRWSKTRVVYCNECDFQWKSRTSANSLEYHQALLETGEPASTTDDCDEDADQLD